MKKSVLLVLFVLMYVLGIAQPISQRGTSAVTVQDARLFAQYNFRPPVFPDTTSANAQIGLDSCGALIFSRDINAYYYRACSPKRWVAISSGGGSVDTTSLSNRINNKWDLFGNSNAIAGTNFLGTTNNIPLEFRIKNVKSGIIDSANKNVSLGFNTLKLNTPNGSTIGTYNTVMGYNAMSKDTFGAQNVAIGGAAMGTLTTNAQRNVAIGYAAMNQTRTPSYDVALGWGALPRDYYGSANVAIGADVANFLPPGVGDTMRYNTMIGYASGYQKFAGRNNVFIGDSTGALNQTGSRNVFIGSRAGKNETGSDKLYIANSSTTSPLIKGDFANQNVIIDGKLLVGGSQVPDSTLDVKGGVRFQALLPSNNTSDSMLVIKSNGGVGYRSVPSGGGQNGRFGNDTATIVMAKVHNNSGVVLTNGKVVFLATSGTNADAPSVRLANNKADSTSANTFGFVSGSIAVNDTGWIILSGKIEKLNTAAFSNGDVIYLDSISGEWTKTKPKAPYHMVYLGVIVKSNAGNGSIFVKCQNGYEADEIHDFQITSVQNNQILVYSDTQKVWKNRSIYSVVDTTNTIATKTNLSLKLNISDTATMLSPYIRLAGTGLTKSSQTLNNNLSTGVSGGQSVVGGTAASENLTLSSTSNATKGKLLFGTSAYDEVNNRLGIGTVSPADRVHVIGTDYATFRLDVTNTTGNNEAACSFSTYDGSAVTNCGGLTNTNSTWNYQAYGANSTILYASRNGGLGLMARNASANIRFYTGGDATSNERMRIFNGGNIAIGTSTDAGYKLDVNGTARAVTSLESPIIRGNTTSGGTLTLGSTSNATKGKILFGTSAYDEVNNRLGIGTTSPATDFHLSYSNNAYGQGAIIQNTNTGTTAITGLLLRNSSAVDVAQFSYYPSNYIVAAQANSVSFGSVGQQKLSFGANTSANGSVAQDIIFSTLGTNSTYQMQIKGNGNVQINTNTDAGYRFDVNGTARVQGALNFNPTNTAAGTTGNQTINKTSGTVNIAAAGTTVTVTNSLVTASSIVFAVIRTNDATATIKNVVPAAGSFTINLNAATTAETSIGFFVIN